MRDSLLRLPIHNPINKTYELTLSNGAITIIDEEDVSIVEGYQWTNVAGYAGRVEKKNGVRKSIKLHREIVKCPRGSVVDHINGDTLDNRKVNLRICTQAENIRNSTKHSRKEYTRYKGIFKKSSGNWTAMIQVNKKSYHLGSFKYEEDAAFAYDKAAEKLHGGYAKLNRPYDEMRAALLRVVDDLETKRYNTLSTLEFKVFSYAIEELRKVLDDHE